MAIRKTILATGEVYHVLNRSVQRMPIFRGKRENAIFLEATKYYLQPNPPIRFSIYRTKREKFPIKLEKQLVTIINFCLMPNHYHFTLRQEKQNGIRIFIQRLSNSFAHYFSVKYKNRGHVFEGNFKAVRVETDEQLVHLSRYIHLNPVTSYLVENPEDYPYSSYCHYLDKVLFDFIDSSLVMDQFSSPKGYKKFTLAQKNYQRELEKIKHLALEDV